jgi:hypothetical protein
MPNANGLVLINAPHGALDTNALLVLLLSLVDLAPMIFHLAFLFVPHQSAINNVLNSNVVRDLLQPALETIAVQCPVPHQAVITLVLPIVLQFVLLVDPNYPVLTVPVHYLLIQLFPTITMLIVSPNVSGFHQMTMEYALLNHQEYVLELLNVVIPFVKLMSMVQTIGITLFAKKIVVSSPNLSVLVVSNNVLLDRDFVS